MPVKVVTDSTCDLSPQVLGEMGVTVVPLRVHVGDRTFLDGIDLAPSEFYRLLRQEKVLPRTSQPSPAEFLKVYRDLTSDGSSVVSIHLSSRLSGTFQSAVMAKENLPQADIEVVDSRLASLGIALVVREAAIMARRGASKQEVVDATRRNIERCHTLFIVDTLDYLYKNGRIGKAAHLVGSLLSLKPILALDREGVVAARDKVRGKNKALERAVEVASCEVRPGSRVQAAVLHADCPEAALFLKERLCSMYQVMFLLEGVVGSVIGSHVGPGTAGFILMEVDS
ncbi:MAG: DegV family protein [Bacillota bacterium]